eukprot:TRINITY_DN10599_c0_g1_i12.p2 TRINITY_DN10599_c0_g1~~TRINITY_DN10599_c0_g1_i12.p2  ORF type:complete len:299 (-),score=25.34 TRINITY_DN10599_c0_g1_i12:421-1317(-)
MCIRDSLICMLLKLVFKKLKTFEEVMDHAINCWIVLFFVIHPSIVKSSLNLLTCRTIGSEDVMTAALEIECGGSFHKNLLYAVALPSLVFCILAPLFAIGHVRSVRKGLMQSKDNYDLVRTLDDEQKRQLRKIITRFAFLFNSYENRKYYWESVALLWSSLVVFLSATLPLESSPLHGVALLVLLVAMYYSQHYAQPFIDKEVNELFSTAIKILGCSLAACQILFAFSEFDALRTLCLSLLIIANIWFMHYVLVRLGLMKLLVGADKLKKAGRSEEELSRSILKEGLSELQISAIDRQ